MRLIIVLALVMGAFFSSNVFAVWQAYVGTSGTHSTMSSCLNFINAVSSNGGADDNYYWQCRFNSSNNNYRVFYDISRSCGQTPISSSVSQTYTTGAVVSSCDATDSVCNSQNRPNLSGFCGPVCSEGQTAEGSICTSGPPVCEILGQSWNGSACVCPEGQEVNPFENKCQPFCIGGFEVNGSCDSSICWLGCKYNRVGLHIIGPSGRSTGVFRADGSYCFSGNIERSCAGDSEPSYDPITEEEQVVVNDKFTCGNGTVYAVYAGTAKCWPVSDYVNTTPAPEFVETQTDIQTTKTENPDGSTTQTETVSKTTTKGNSSNTSTKTTTTTVNPDGSTSTTITETEEDEGFDGTGFEVGDGPSSFWESSYPDGLDGIWNKHKETLNNSPLVSWLDGWAVPNTGNIPSYSISFDFGFISFGTLEIPMDLFASIAPYLRAILIFTALLCARRLVFGG